LQKPLETLADLFMGKVIATLESVLAAFHGLDEAGFFLEIARQHILHQVVGIPALLGGRLRELRFQFPGDMYFHFVGSFSENTLLRYHVGVQGSLPFPLRCASAAALHGVTPDHPHPVALRRAGCKKSQAARILGLTRNALRYRLTQTALEA
jgi:hypothetical protein